MSDGSSPEDWPRDGPFGSRSAAADPVALKMPAYGAGMPPNANQGVSLGASSACSAAVASAALIGVAALPPSM